MRAADRHGTAAARRLSQQQRALDAASTQLLALQLERGCRLNTTTGSNTSNNEKNQTTGTANASSADGDDTTIQILEQRVQQQTTANARLDDELAETKRTLHGACACACENAAVVLV